MLACSIYLQVGENNKCGYWDALMRRIDIVQVDWSSAASNIYKAVCIISSKCIHAPLKNKNKHFFCLLFFSSSSTNLKRRVFFLKKRTDENISLKHESHASPNNCLSLLLTKMFSTVFHLHFVRASSEVLSSVEKYIQYKKQEIPQRRRSALTTNVGL